MCSIHSEPSESVILFHFGFYFTNWQIIENDAQELFWDSILPSLKPSVPKMLQNNAVYQIKCSRCGSSYVGQTSRHLQQRFREHVGNKGPIKTHFIECDISPTEKDISILGKSWGGENRLLTLEALFIKEINPILNTKDEYKSRTLTLKF